MSPNSLCRTPLYWKYFSALSILQYTIWKKRWLQSYDLSNAIMSTRMVLYMRNCMGFWMYEKTLGNWRITTYCNFWWYTYLNNKTKFISFKFIESEIVSERLLCITRWIKDCNGNEVYAIPCILTLIRYFWDHHLARFLRKTYTVYKK